MKFITEPPVPRKRPDLTTFIHRPLQHFREILKLVQMIASHCRVDSEEHANFNNIISELQVGVLNANICSETVIFIKRFLFYRLRIAR